MNVLILDTETSGLSNSKNVKPETVHLWPFIVQFSYIIINLETYEIVKLYDSIVKVKSYNVISEESIKLHGITNEISLLKGQSKNAVLTEFCNDIENVDLIVAHNMNFDLSVVKVEMMRLISEEKDQNKKQQFEQNLDKISKLTNLYCTMQESIDLCKIEKENSRGKYFKFPSLLELHKKLFNKEPKNLHNSLNDILITLRCFIKMKHDIDIVEVNSEIKDMIHKLL